MRFFLELKSSGITFHCLIIVFVYSFVIGLKTWLQPFYDQVGSALLSEFVALLTLSVVVNASEDFGAPLAAEVPQSGGAPPAAEVPQSGGDPPAAEVVAPGVWAGFADWVPSDDEQPVAAAEPQQQPEIAPQALSKFYLAAHFKKKLLAGCPARHFFDMPNLEQRTPAFRAGPRARHFSSSSAGSEVEGAATGRWLSTARQSCSTGFWSSWHKIEAP